MINSIGALLPIGVVQYAAEKAKFLSTVAFWGDN